MNEILAFENIHDVIDVKALVRAKLKGPKEYDELLMAYYAVVTDVGQMLRTILEEFDEEVEEIKNDKRKTKSKLEVGRKDPKTNKRHKRKR